MLRTLVLMLVLSGSQSFAAKPVTYQMPELLSYDELLEMNSADRAEYLHEFGGLLAMIEDMDSRYEVAGEVRGMKEQVARLMRAFDPLGSADAAEAGALPAAPSPTALTSTPPVAPTPPAKPTAPAAPAAATTPNTPVKTTTPAAAKPATAPAATSAKPAAPAPAPAPKPAPAAESAHGKVTCTPVDENDPKRAELRKAFQESPDHGSCIRGGVFSSYPKGQYKAKSCKAPPASFRKTYELTGKERPCENGTQLCNPAVYCFGIEHENHFYSGLVCANFDQHFTRNCNNELNAKHLNHVMNLSSMKNGTPTQKEAWAALHGIKAKPCDPEKVSKGDSRFASIYNDLGAATQKKLGDLCEGEKHQAFRALFCEECQNLAATIEGMNKRFTTTFARRAKPKKAETASGKAPAAHQ